MNALVSAALWVVGKALAPVTDGLLEAWDATKKLGLNIESLKMELLLVKATLELAGGKQIHGQAIEDLLAMLRDSAHRAEDLLDELDYFRIQDELHGTCDAADQHGKGGVHDLAFHGRHAATAVGKRVSCCAWPRARQRSINISSSVPNTNQEVSGCIPKLGKLLPCSSSPHVPNDHSGQLTLLGGAPQTETPILVFDRVDASRRMEHIVEQLKPVRTEVTKILQGCDRMAAPDISQSRPITTGQSIEPKLYGRDHIMNTIIHDMTKGKYCDNDLTVLPIVGPGGIGKTTLIQNIHRNQQVQNHFHVIIWVCVSLNFTLNKLLEEIKKYTPQVEGEKDGRPEELIEQRLKSKRFLLVLDDIWEISNEDDWKRLLLPLKTSQEKGSMILLTTRFPAIVKKVKTTTHIELEGLESVEFRKLFLAFVFDDEPLRSDQNILLETGDKIMRKLKGSPLAAKTVGALLRKNLSLRHWRRVLVSKEWETWSDANDIMPALKLSYEHLPFHQQQCFSYSALFPEDYKYSAKELINFWTGIDILQPNGPNQTLEDIGMSNLNDLIAYGFFKEEETNGRPCYVMHDLLHDLALKVASHECLIVHHSNVGSLEIPPSICHLSIIFDDDMFWFEDDSAISSENLKRQLRKLKTSLKVKKLHTLMLFGPMDESFAHILGDLFSEASTLRVLRLVNMSYSVESVLHKFSSLIHLRYLCLGITKHSSEMQLPIAISRFYHLKILDLGLWYKCCELPKGLSNLAKLRRFYTSSDELHSHICNVEKLRLLEELKVFRVNKESEGFELKQLEHMVELRELGIYNLENIHTKEEATKANLREKNYLERLTLDWDSERSSSDPVVETVVLESLQPHGYLNELCIRGHRAPSFPPWLGDNLAVEALESLHLSGVSWEYLPPLGKMWGLVKVTLENIAALEEFVIEQSFCMLIRLELIGLGSFGKWVPSKDVYHMFPLLQVLIIRDCPKLLEMPFSNHIVYSSDQDWNTDWFLKLRQLEIEKCPELLLMARIPWTKTLHLVNIRDIKLLGELAYIKKKSSLSITGKDDLQSLDEVVAFNNMTGLELLELKKGPPLQLKQLLVLTSLKRLIVEGLDALVGLVGGEGGVEWQHPVEHLNVRESRGDDLLELLTHLPRLSKLQISYCGNITQLAVGLDKQQTTSAAADVGQEKEDGLLLFPSHLSDSLRELVFYKCPELVLVDHPSTSVPVRGLQALRSLQVLEIRECPKILSAKRSFSCCPFPTSLLSLTLRGVEDMGTLEPLSNLTFLTQLKLLSCGENLRCKGLGPLITTEGQLRKLTVLGSTRFFAGRHPNPRRVLENEAGEEQEQQQLVTPPSSSNLQELWTDDAMGLVVVPICSFLSSTLTSLFLFGYCQEMERFTKEQEDALRLLVSLKKLYFRVFNKLQRLPAGLHMFTNLNRLQLWSCPAIRSLPKDGLPKSLQELDVSRCGNDELKEQCRGLLGTIPKIILEHGY